MVHGYSFYYFLVRFNCFHGKNKDMSEEIQTIKSQVHENLTSMSESMLHFYGKVCMWIGIALAGISQVDLKNSIQLYCLFGSAIAVTLSCIFYVLKIYEKRINIKILSEHLKNELKKEC